MCVWKYHYDKNDKISGANKKFDYEVTVILIDCLIHNNFTDVDNNIDSNNKFDQC